MPLLAALLASLALLAATAVPAAAAPRPGAAGLGDRLVPSLGNGGYDVLHYDLDLRYETSDPAQSIDGDVTILARATQSLSRFNLDFAGGAVGSVSVNRKRARFRREGEELVVTPRKSLRKRKKFVVRIKHFTATPTEPGEEFSSTALFITPDGSATAPQPYFAHFIYPSNDHPRDKATFTFRFDVPAGTVAIANGIERGHWTRHGRSTWLWEERHPMATELTQLAVGNWEFTSEGSHRGVFFQDATPPSLTEFMQPIFPLEPGHLDYMEELVGRYPFDAWGELVVDADLGFALETQEISLFDKTWFTDYGQGVWDPTMLHELAHMWFGDSVAPYEWSDLWLNEGHASWYEFVYAEERGFLEEDTEDYPDEQGYPTLEELMRAVYAHSDQWRHDFGPVALPSSGSDVGALFSFNVYHGGALVLYALRQKIGDSAFERVERAWVKEYRGESASTDDFIALASEVSGRRSVKRFLRDWLYGDTTPTMPGHEDWTADPVVEGTGLRAEAVRRMERRR